MSATYAELLTRKANYLAAEAKALQAQEYSMGSGGAARRLARADLAEIRKAIADLDNLIATHPDNPARIRRRVYTLRPAC